MAVVKIIELVGSSKTSSADAAKQALDQAKGSLRNIRAVDIVSTGIRGENLDEYRAHVRVAFIIEDTDVERSPRRGPSPHAGDEFSNSPPSSKPGSAAAGILARLRNPTRPCTTPPTNRNTAASASVKTRSNFSVRRPSTTVNSNQTSPG